MRIICNVNSQKSTDNICIVSLGISLSLICKSVFILSFAKGAFSTRFVSIFCTHTIKLSMGRNGDYFVNVIWKSQQKKHTQKLSLLGLQKKTFALLGLQNNRRNLEPGNHRSETCVWRVNSESVCRHLSFWEQMHLVGVNGRSEDWKMVLISINSSRLSIPRIGSDGVLAWNFFHSDMFLCSTELGLTHISIFFVGKPMRAYA